MEYHIIQRLKNNKKIRVYKHKDVFGKTTE